MVLVDPRRPQKNVRRPQETPGDPLGIPDSLPRVLPTDHIQLDSVVVACLGFPLCLIDRRRGARGPHGPSSVHPGATASATLSYLLRVNGILIGLKNVINMR